MKASRQVITTITLALLSVASLSLAIAADSPLPQRPNIILLVADDLGYGELGCQGNPEIPTPHIDSLANNGIRFTQGYVTAAFCSASRAGLMTGRFQTRFGYEFNPIGAQNEDPNAGLPPREKTIADLLVNAGYITGIFGKWHLGGTAKYNPIRRGFDEFFGFLHEGHYFAPPPYHDTTTWLRRRVLPGGGKGRWFSPNGRLIYSTHMGYTEPDYDADNPIYRAGQPVQEEQYLTDALTRESVDFIQRNRSAPFFLYVPYNAVHSPMQGAQKYMERFSHIQDIQRRIFAAMLSNLDDSVGAILETLRAHQLEQRTLIFFISDNGGPTKELTSSNLPLRGGKGSVYEGGIRVPFLMQWRGVLEAGASYTHPVSSLDIFQTAAAVSRATPPSGVHFDGTNLIPFVTGQNLERPHEELFWRQGNKTALRRQDWKLLKNPLRGHPPRWGLYNLAHDEAETKDLAAAHPKRLARMIERWTDWNDQMIPPVWSPQRR